MVEHEEPIRRGDLILLEDGYYALVKELLTASWASVRLSNGLVICVNLDVAAPLGLGPGRSNVVHANFAEEMRPDWADPHSPRYRPPPPEHEES